MVELDTHKLIQLKTLPQLKVCEKMSVLYDDFV